MTTAPSLPASPSAATVARIAGWSSVLLAVVAIPANVVLSQFGTSATDGTARDWVAENDMALRLAICAVLVSVILDVIVAWALAVYFRRHALVQLAASLRVAYAAAFLVAGGLLVPALAHPAAAESAIVGFQSLWQFALALFGAHLLVLALVLRQSRVVPVVLVWCVGVAGSAYLVDGVQRVVLAAPGAFAVVLTGVVALASIVGELWLAGWLIARGPRRADTA